MLDELRELASGVRQRAALLSHQELRSDPAPDVRLPQLPMRRLIIALVCLVVAALLLYRFVPHQGSLVETVALANGPFDLRVRAYSEVGTGYVYSGWEYAVTTDSGKTWSRWDATRDLQGWRCCNYSLIDSVRFEPSGRGTMYLGLIEASPRTVPRLHTLDFGRHWAREPAGATDSLR